MAQFMIKGKDFKDFLDGVSCKGVLQFKSKGKTDAPLFSAFYIDVDKKEQKISVLTIDTFFSQIKQDISIKAKVMEEGVIEIADKVKYDKVFSTIDLEKILVINSDDNYITIETIDEDDWYRRRIVGDKSFDEIDQKMETLFDWRNSHELTDIKVENDKGEVEKRQVWKFTVGEAFALYPMRVKTTKKNLKKLVSDSVNLTKDNDTVFKCENGLITVWTGKPNANDQARHRIHYQDIGDGTFDFAVKFSALQAIVPNLQEEVILNFRKTSGETIVLRIETMSKTMHQILSIGSQDKDGVLYDSEEEDV